MSPKSTPPSRQIITFSYGAVGEYLLTSVFLNEVWRTRKVGHSIVFATRNREALRALSEQYPFIQLYPFPSFYFLKVLWRSFFVGTLMFVPLTFGLLPTSVKIASRMLTLKRKSKRLGFTGLHDTSCAYDISVAYRLDALFLENLFSLGKQAGFALSSPAPFLFSSHPEALKPFSLTENTYLVVAPFASNPKRSLPTERWTGILSTLSRKYPDLPVVLVGSPQEKETAESIILRSGHSLIFSAVGTTFPQIITLITQAKVFLGVDSGLTHIAAVAHKPSVVVGNLSNPTWLPRYNPNATILTNAEHCTCDGAKGGDCVVLFEGKAYYRCMLEVANDDIIKALREKIEGKIARDTDESI